MSEWIALRIPFTTKKYWRRAWRINQKVMFIYKDMPSLCCEFYYYYHVGKLTCTARMRGMYFFQRLLGFGPSINFWSTWMDLLPFETTIVISFIKFGIHGVPSGRICTVIWHPQLKFKQLGRSKSKSNTVWNLQTFAPFSLVLHLPLFSAKAIGKGKS